MKKILVLTVVFLFLAAGRSWACWGFRPMGMGGTFVAVADDANCAYWNRAGAAQLENFSDGENQIIYTGSIYNQNGFFSRKERSGNAYYDSINYVQKLDKDSGWTFAGSWSGGAQLMLSPGYAIRIPNLGIDWLKNQSVGIGYFFWNYESYTNYQGNQIRVNGMFHQIHLDWLWRVMKNFSVGVHIERFWQFAGNVNSPDVPSLNESATFGPDKMNFRPSLAWWVSPDWIVNAGIYDLFNCGGGPHFSAGTEYRLGQWAIRGGLYNFGGSTGSNGLITFGCGYQFSEDLEIGYWGGIWEKAADIDKWWHNVGVSWKWGGVPQAPATSKKPAVTKRK